MLLHDLEIETEPLQHRFDDYAAGSVERGVDNPQRFRLADNLWIENQCFEPLHVRLIDFLAEHCHFPLPIFRQRREGFGRGRVYFSDDSARVRLNHLRPIAEVDFIAVVMRGIVTRRYHDARGCFEIANGEGEFWHRTRPIEYKRIATVF